MVQSEKLSLAYSWMGPPSGVLPCVASASYIERPVRAPTRRIVHNLWVLDYARSDCGRVRVGSARSRWWPRAPRIAHLYPPLTPYWEDESGVRGPIREAWLVFDGGDQVGLRGLLGPRQRFACIADPGGCLDAPLRDMAHAGSTLGEAGFWRAQASMATVFDLLRSAAPRADGTYVLPATDSQTDSHTSVVEAAHDYFRSHLGEKVTLAEVAGHLAMSPSTLSHRYAQEADQSPMAALTAIRIEFAKSLLLRGLKMEAIAFQTGFFDAFHFSKTFKKLCGVSPSRFRCEFGRGAPGNGLDSASPGRAGGSLTAGG